MDVVRSIEEAGTSLTGVFETTCDRVFGFTLKRCGNTLLAEEITAQAFEAASRRFAAGRGEQVTLPWLLTVARRRLIDHWRSASAEANRIRRLKDESLRLASIKTIPGTDVDHALHALSERHRAALVLRYLDDLSVSEVAEALGVGYKATESLLVRARHAFEVAYEENR